MIAGERARLHEAHEQIFARNALDGLNRAVNRERSGLTENAKRMLGIGFRLFDELLNFGTDGMVDEGH